MTILNFVTQEQLDNLDEEPKAAFMGLVNHAQRSLDQRIAKFDPENQYEWKQREDLQQKFMNVVVASGKRLEIEPFTKMMVPKIANYNDHDYKQFQADLDHFVTQLVLDNTVRAKRTSVEVLPTSKDQIRSYVHGLRKCVEDSNMTAPKKRALLDKLDAFEKELERRRLSILAVTLLSFEILAIPGATWASVDMAHKLITNITQTVAEAKQEEEKTRKVGPTQQPKALSPPRASKDTSNESWSSKSDLDNDIPF